ncbi:protein lin-28 homolog isoform X2 [Tigriopus californicus]|nr:protein lin-28 homolog isoform X2 [Tigriopus californicus]
MSADQSDSENPTAATSEEKWLPGKCKWFNVAKGWGFVVSEDGEHEVFVHQSALQMTGFRSLGDEEEIEYQATQSDKGLEATAVRAKGGGDCQGSHRRPGAKKKLRKVRCFNCGDFASHIASKCPKEPMPKCCHHCKSTAHLIEDCPTLPDDKKKKKGPSS